MAPEIEVVVEYTLSIYVFIYTQRVDFPCAGLGSGDGSGEEA